MEVSNIKTNHKWSVISYRKKAKKPSLKEIVKSDRKKSQKVRHQSLNRQRHHKKQRMFSEGVDFRTVKIRLPFKGYWNMRCYGNAFPCMGCALSAPLYGNTYPQVQTPCNVRSVKVGFTENPTMTILKCMGVVVLSGKMSRVKLYYYSCN